MSYITYFVLTYWSNATFILILNLLLVIVLCKDYKISNYKQDKRGIKLILFQQLFGFVILYLTNILVKNSVTLMSYVTPTSIILIGLVALVNKNKEKRPKLKQILGIMLIILGIIFINKV